MILLYVLSVIALTCAQEASELGKLDEGDELKQQEKVEALIGQVGNMGMLLENYRRVILSGITEASDICDFVEKLAYSDEFDDNNKIPDDQVDNDDMGVRLYRSFFKKLDDPRVKAQLLTKLENHIDLCFAGSPDQLVSKRDKSQLQKVRFHSWGGKRSRGAPKVVIRTPFHSWGGKRSAKGN